MFDFLGKKPVSKGRQDQRTQAVPNSLLDVVVPFPQSDAKNSPSVTPSAAKNSSHNSLLSQFDVLAQERQNMDAEKQALERAEMRAKKASFERSEQLARMEAERDASLRFEEKANKLAAEIERVKETKFRQSNEPHSNTPDDGYPPSHSGQHTPRNSETYHVGVGRRQNYDRATEVGQNRPLHSRPEHEYLSEDRREREQFERFQRFQNATRENGYPSAEYDYREGRSSLDSSHGYYPKDRREQPRHDEAAYRNGRDFVDRAGIYQQRDNSSRSGFERPSYREQMHRERGHHSFQPQRQNSPMASSPEYHPQPERDVSTPAHSPSSGGLYGQNHSVTQNSSGSGLDLDKIFMSILRSWKMIGIFAVAGAVIAGVYAKSLPNKYEAWAELLIDPQGITLIDKQLSTTGYGGEAMIAYLESQLRIIESTSVLNVVIDKEELYNDPEFSSNGLFGSGLVNILNPLSSGEESSKDRQYIIDNLQDKLTIARGSRTFIISIGMMTEDGDKSARIANAIAKAYVTGESGARSKVARDASENLSDKLDTLRNRVLLAERKVSNYKAENGLVTSGGKLISEVQLSRINEQLAVASIETITAKTRMEQLRKIDLSDVISGALPASLNTGTLSQLRVRYATLKSTADRLATKLGPKHPERIAASAELESARGQISREIRRSISGSQKDLERAKERQKGLKQQLNTVKATVAGAGNSLIELRELQRELEAHKSVYENYLLRSRETSEQEGLTTTNARVITPATAPLEKASPNRKVIAGVGLIAGGLLGLLLAMLKGLLSTKISSRTRAKQTDIEDNTSPHAQNTNSHNPNYPYPHTSGGAGSSAPYAQYPPPRYR